MSVNSYRVCFMIKRLQVRTTLVPVCYFCKHLFLITSLIKPGVNGELIEGLHDAVAPIGTQFCHVHWFLFVRCGIENEQLSKCKRVNFHSFKELNEGHVFERETTLNGVKVVILIIICTLFGVKNSLPHSF